MKIIQLLYSLSSGGAERFVVSLSNQLAEMGHDVTVCMLLSSGNDKYIFNRQFMRPDVHFHSMGFEPGFSLRKVRALEQYVLSVNPDVVHCHLNVIPYVFRLSLISRDIRFVHTLHSVAENASGKDWQRVINRFFYSKGYIVPVLITDVKSLAGLPCLRQYVRRFLHIKGIMRPLSSFMWQDIMSRRIRPCL